MSNPSVEEDFSPHPKEPSQEKPQQAQQVILIKNKANQKNNEEDEEELELHHISKEIPPSELEEELDYQFMSNLDTQKSRPRFQRPNSQTSQRSAFSTISRASNKINSFHKQFIQTILKSLKDPPTLVALFDKYQPQNKELDIVEMKAGGRAKIKKYKECIYFGEILNSKRHGKGVMIYSDLRMYEGEWENDLKNGKGLEILANENYYEGQFVNGKPEGVGIFIWATGETYEGEWKGGLKHGSGIWKGIKGESYTGEWKNGKADGYGIHKWRNGDRYDGEFKEFLKHGQGTERFFNGDYYTGTYVNGKPDGYGEYYWGNGCEYKGTFRNGLRHGKGVWKKGKDNCDVYEGEWANDKKCGKGVYRWKSGNLYQGEYFDDMRHGYGEMEWTDGSIYKGTWERGIQHGEGELFLPGKPPQSGLFVNNEFVGDLDENTRDPVPIKSSLPKVNYETPLKVSRNPETTHKFLIPLQQEKSRDSSTRSRSSQNAQRRVAPVPSDRRAANYSFSQTKNSLGIQKVNSSFSEKSNEDSKRLRDIPINIKNFERQTPQSQLGRILKQQAGLKSGGIKQVNLKPSDIGFNQKQEALNYSVQQQSLYYSK